MTLSLVLLFLMFQPPLGVESLVLEADLRDGRQVRGTIDGSSLKFSGVTVTGETVEVHISKPPEWSNVTWVCLIDWDAARRIYVVRNFSWTGELRQIWEQLIVADESGEPVTLNGNEIQTARFGYFHGN